MQITGGKVSFRRVVQPAQYESKEGLVELTFVVPEGEGAAAQSFLDTTAQMAQAKALELVGLKPATSTGKPDLKVVELPPSDAVQKAKDEAVQKAKDETKAAAAASMNSKDKAKAAPKDELDGLDGPQITTNPENRTDPDGLDEQPKEITDVELRDAVSRWVAENKNAVAVKELRTKFAGAPPKGLNDIPQAKRTQFLTELKSLPKAAA